MRHDGWSIAGVVGLTVLGAASPAPAAVGAPEAQFVAGAAVVGDCRHRTVVTAPSDGQRLLVNFRDLAVATDDSTASAGALCIVEFRVERPAGWAFTIPGWGFDGALRLREDAVGQLTSSYYFREGTPRWRCSSSRPPRRPTGTTGRSTATRPGRRASSRRWSNFI
ncbi:hypothetical protein GCM10010124_35590 [Pilimelia terevasa]|uniref:Uncharacterized protein n=1 Tax=Pilimelia terevasa TaxID=53372 RepID=A0A8J3BRE4_9ACTN|nr:hypothetical protein GCM10010124_35590 [Pilimelia terevasa]